MSENHQNNRDYLPAFLAAAVLLVAAGIKALRIIPDARWDDFEVICNAVMLGDAVVSFFWVGLPSKADHGRRLGAVLSNLMVSALAVPMNITVFDHAIRWNDPLNGLWGGHAAWILWAAVQLLFLSGLAEVFLHWIKSFLAWLGKREKELGAVLTETAGRLKLHNRGVAAIIAVISVLWALYLGSRVLAAGTCAVLADFDTLKGSVLLWLAGVMAGTLVYIAPALFYKAKEALKISVQRKPLEVLETGGTNGNSVPAQDRQRGKSTKPVDVTVAIWAFFVVPLLLPGMAAIFSEPGFSFIKGDKSDFSTWRNFFEAFMDAAQMLLEALM